MRPSHAGVVALLHAAFLPVAAQASSFTILPNLPGTYGSVANGVSPDGRTVVGESDDRPWYWTEATGTVQLATSQLAYAASDGGAIVGTTRVDGISRSYRWTATGGMQLLGSFPGPIGELSSWANDVSGDGSTVVGYSGSTPQAFVWTASRGATTIGPTGYPGAIASAISYDGSTVVGHTQDPRAFRWSASGGFQLLDGLPGSYGSATALDVSLDGGAIAGYARAANDSLQAVRWTAAGIESIVPDELMKPGWRSSGLAIDGSGDVIVGDFSYYDGNYGNAGAFLWTPATGMQSLATILGALGFDVAGWTFDRISDVSLDGHTFVGYGRIQDQQRSFVIHLDSIPDVANVPEPGAAVLLAIGAGMLGACRRFPPS